MFALCFGWFLVLEKQKKLSGTCLLVLYTISAYQWKFSICFKKKKVIGYKNKRVHFVNTSSNCIFSKS